MILRLSAGKLPDTVMGPKILKLGDFVNALPDSIEDVPGAKSGLLSRYGFHDKTTAAYTLALAKDGSLPPMTVAYFPLNDDYGHSDGLHQAAHLCLESFDEFLGEFVQAVGGWDVIDRDYAILIVGDHGQTEWAGEEKPDVVYLDDVLKDFRQGATAGGLEPGDQLVICPNMRAASVYLADESCRKDVCETLRKHPGVDQVIQRVQRPGEYKMFSVETNGRGRLTFARDEALPQRENGQLATDRYGNRWRLFGELQALDLEIDPDGRLVEGEYLNALERIEGAFGSEPSPIWVTAQREAEFAVGSTSTHEGGSHGSLNHADTLAGMVTAANVNREQLPDPMTPRLIDVLDLCLGSLGIDRMQSDSSCSQRESTVYVD